MLLRFIGLFNAVLRPAFELGVLDPELPPRALPLL